MKSHLGVQEVAKILKKDRSTIIRWIQNGKFKGARKVGGEYQISFRSFKKWYEENNKALLNLRHSDASVSRR